MERRERTRRARLFCSSLAPLLLAAACSTTEPEAESRPAPGPGEGTLRVGDDRLFYEIRGDGRPIVFVNGGSMDLRQWDAQAEAFAQEYRVVRFDHRGWGRSSDISESFSPAEDLAALLDELELEDVVLVGCSFGGGVVLDCALEQAEHSDHPNRIRALVLIAPAVGGYPWSQSFIERSQRMAAARAEGGVDSHVAVILEDPHFIPGASKDPDLAARAEELLRANYSLYSNDFRLLRQTHPPTYDRLDDVRLPTLLVIPEHDVPDVIEIVSLLDERIPDSKRVDIEGAGHMVNMEQPAKLDAAILEFLSDLDG